MHRPYVLLSIAVSLPTVIIGFTTSARFPSTPIHDFQKACPEKETTQLFETLLDGGGGGGSSTTNPDANREKTPQEQAYETVMRFELKNEILKCALEFKQMQADLFAMEDAEKKAKARSRKKKRKNADEKGIAGFFGAESAGTATVTLGDKGEEIIDLATQLSKLNPTPVPTYGWMGHKGGEPFAPDCLLDGKWKLRFTSGSDATFRESPKRGKANSFQIVNATEGIFTNIIDFERGKVKGFSVVVRGEAASDTQMDLTFTKVIVRRNSRFPDTFGVISIPLPSPKFLRGLTKVLSLGRAKASRRAYFELMYLDKDFRMHQTGEGNWFIQTKLD